MSENKEEHVEYEHLNRECMSKMIRAQTVVMKQLHEEIITVKEENAELREALIQSTEVLGNFWSNTGSLGSLSQKELNEKVLAK